MKEIREAISIELYNDMNSLIGKLQNQESSQFSHGDLIPTNILKDELGQYWFIDWEWAGNRTPSYDKTLFLLFSQSPLSAIGKMKDHSSDSNDLKEMYADSLLISAREIKNWMQVGTVTVEQRNHYISLWKKTFEQALKGLKLYL